MSVEETTLASRAYAYLNATFETFARQISVKRWNAFVDGERLEPLLLVHFLMAHFAGSGNVGVDKEVHSIRSEKEELALYDRILLSRSPQGQTFILHTAVHHYVASDTTSLIIAAHNENEEESPRVYVFSNLERHDAMNSTERPENVHFVMNARYAYHIDNGLFVFAFLDYFFRVFTTEDDDEIATFPSQRKEGYDDPRDLARLMMVSLLRRQRIEDRIVEIYLEITHMIKTKHDPRRLEHAKQHLCQWVAYGTSIDTTQEEEPDERVLLSKSFFELAKPGEVRDPIESEAKKKPNDVFSEMMTFIRFLQRVVVPEQNTASSGLRVKKKNYSVKEVGDHIYHLLYRLVMHIDSFNMPPTITPALEKRANITARDFYGIANSNFLSGHLLVSYIRANRWLDDTQCILHHHNHIEGAAVADMPALKRWNFIILSTTMTIVNKSRSKRKRVVEEEEHCSLLVIDNNEEEGLVSYSFYTPSIDVDEMEGMLERVDKIVRSYRLRVYRTELVSQFDPLLQDYFPGSRIALTIVYELSRIIRAATINPLPAPFDVLDMINLIISRINIDRLETLVTSILRFAQVAFLTAFFQLPEVQELSDDDDDDEKKKKKKNKVSDKSKVSTLGIESTLIDLAILCMENEYLSDNIISDMITLMRHTEDCYIFDSTYWATMLERGIKESSAFKRTEISRLLMALNQDNNHWSLAIIDKSKARVEYYSSLENDSYYTRVFKANMKAFLGVQQPGIEYTFVRRKGAIQPLGSMDCALYVLNEMRVICGQPDDDIAAFLTRESVLSRLIEAIKKSRLEITRKVREIERLVCIEYFTPPAGWPSIVESPHLFTVFQRYVRLVIERLLISLEVYSGASIAELMENLANNTIDEDTLCNSAGQYFASILRPQKTKRDRESDDVEAERNKARKGIIIEASLLSGPEEEFIRDYLSRLLVVQEYVKLLRDDENVPEYKREQQYYKTQFGPEMREVFNPFIDAVAKVVDSLIEFMYREFPELDTFYNYFMVLLVKYGRPSKVSRIMLKCAICATSTSRVNLLFKLPFCSKSCLEHYCQ